MIVFGNNSKIFIAYFPEYYVISKKVEKIVE